MTGPSGEPGASPDLVVHVLDDQEAIRTLLARVLGFHERRVRVWRTAGEFLDGADLEHAACVLVDLRLPDASAVDVARAIRQREPDVPVLLMSGAIDEAAAAAASEAWIDAFIAKPFDIHEVGAAVARATRQRLAALGARGTGALVPPRC